MVQAVRAGGGHQPVSLGDGAWGVERPGATTASRLRRARDLVRLDFAGPHVYRMEHRPVRQHPQAPRSSASSAAVGDRPVVHGGVRALERLRLAENAGHYYRQLLHTSLLAGATGWIAWNNTDFDDLVGQGPYRPPPLRDALRHHRRRRASPSRRCASCRLRPALRRSTCRAVVDVTDVTPRWWSPSYLVAGYPFMVEARPGRSLLRACEQGHVSRPRGRPTAGVTRERSTAACPPVYDLYLLPSAKQLAAPGWAQLRELAAPARRSTCRTARASPSSSADPWWIRTDELFGVRTPSTYGLNDPIEDDVVELRLVAASGRPRPRATCCASASPVAPTRARSCRWRWSTARCSRSTTPAGRRSCASATAQGRRCSATYPLEYLAAAQGRVNPEDTWRLYRRARRGGRRLPLR